MKIFYPKYKREDLIEKLKRNFIDISRTIKITDARLFGSCARGTNTAFSDIDIFIVVGDSDGKSAYSICWDMIGIPEIELHVYTEGEIVIMRRTGNSFLKEVEKDGIILTSTSAK